MKKLPSISGKKLIRILNRYQFLPIRQKGSHVFIRNPVTKKGTIIPVHSNEDLGYGILKSILNDLEINTDKFLAMLKGKK